MKPEEALSKAQRRAANEWFDHTLYSRLNDKLTGRIGAGTWRLPAFAEAEPMVLAVAGKIINAYSSRDPRFLNTP